MLHDPKFVVVLTPEAVQRLNVTTNHFVEQSGGSVDLWDQLIEKGLTYGDVQLITIEGESTKNRLICDAVRTLERNCEIIDIYLGVDPDESVYLIPAVQHGGLVEFQVSDGPAGERGHSADFYDYDEAKKAFDAISADGWKKAKF